MKNRTIPLIIGVVAAYAFLLFRVSELQLAKSGYYTARAASEQSASAAAAMNRGAIYFTNPDGTTLPVAIDKDFPTIYAVPSAIADAAEAANTLAPILDMSADTLQKLLGKPHDNYELLVDKANVAVADEVAGLNLKGIYVDAEPSRYYPLNTVAAQVIGFVGPNASTTGESGHYGIEGYDNATLAAGNDVTLTLDPNVQIESEKLLQSVIASNGATGGSILVEEPKTGKILAMGGYPTFDPNNYASSSYTDFLNPTVQSIYEPGSIFKVLTMAVGIDAGKITPQTTYDDTGTVKIDGDTITNYDLKTHGPYGPGTTMTEVIEHSINTGAIFAENQIGNSTFENYMKAFRVDQKTGIDLPGEVAGTLNGLHPNAPQVNFDTVAYGQGVAVTSVGLITMVGAIANGGVMMRPYVNALETPQAIGQIMTAGTASQVTKMMVDAVDLAGVANISGYSIAGKTGSAFIPNLVTGGYTDQLIDSYVIFAPASNPRFIALIRLNALPETSLAAESVVPAAKELSQYLINYYNIPPDRPVK
ncbi:MAG: penicillin-binding protein 2 [Minisyncoccia bacterium]|jgi:cell division protein FtsI/penicillin-binding protein 2